MVEEFNTCGLTGPVDRTKNEHPDWHYSNYMFGVNRKTKTDGGGSAGVGKITSNLVSDLRNIFFITNREHGETWVGGRTGFEAPYTMGQGEDASTFADTAYLTEENIPADITDITGSMEDDILQPVKEKTNLDWFREVFQINRKDDERGTSWAMLAPLHETLHSSTAPLQSINEYLDIILEEYFWAIMKGSVEIQLGDILLVKENIYGHLDTQFPQKKETWEFFQEISTFPPNSLTRLKPDWAESANLDDAFLSDDAKQNAIDMFEAGSQVVGFKIPFIVEKTPNIKNDSHIELFIKKKSPEIKEDSEYLFRDYLHISGESKRLNSNFGVNVDCVMIIVHPAMVEICRAAEKPDHTKFINKRAKARGFKNVEATFRNLRQSVRSIYNFLIELDTEDENTFASIFGVLTLKDKLSPPKGKRQKRKTGVPKKKQYASPDRIDIVASQNSLTITAARSAFPANQLPANFNLKIYEKKLSGVHDFNMDDDGFQNIQVVSSSNINVTSHSQDSLKIEILDNDFNLKIDNINISRASELRLEDS